MLVVVAVTKAAACMGLIGPGLFFSAVVSASSVGVVGCVSSRASISYSFSAMMSCLLSFWFYNGDMYSTFDLNGGFPWPWVHIWNRLRVKMLSCFEDIWVFIRKQQSYYILGLTMVVAVSAVKIVEKEI